ncbi:hypothetical protein Patl1_29640 [Pistacia atlantica]|uniref:Uncharacterized protein n=1 Tax=Pistacia atlantica TaxID=434234 RepID=A0ACC1AAI0_9ROSI|nr:hypothetical protein Patl1_29640 [Pistacia atlantica]
MHSNLYEGISMSKLICELWEVAGHDLLIEDDLLEEQFPKTEHFVDFIRLCLQPSEIGMQNGEIKTLVAPTITELHQARELEELNCKIDSVIDYVVIMNYLVNSPKDVEVLVQNEIIENWLSDSEDVSTLFQNLQKETNINKDNFTSVGLIDDLKAYYKSLWHKWKATLKQNYFNNPWASIFVIVAIVLLILTITQTVFSIIK